MHEQIIISGFGGQGVLFVGQLLTYAGMAEGHHVTWIPSYGPEMRGGTAHCVVIISDDPIGSPIIRTPTIAMVFNPPSMDKYECAVAAGGVLVANSSLVRSRSQRDDITTAYVPATDLARELGSDRMANVVMLGALLEIRAVVQPESIDKTLDEHIPEHRQHLIEPNKRALARGAEYYRSGR